MNDTLKTIHDVLDARKAIRIRVIDVSKVSTFTDFFVVCAGANDRHIQSLADEVQESLRLERGLKASHVEGYSNAQWVLLDYFDFIVHIFSVEAREFYELENLWADGGEIAFPTLPA